MYSQDETRNKPKWRRSLLAASLLISPVAGVQASGGPSEGTPTASIAAECGENGAFISVDIENGNGKDFFVVLSGSVDDRYPEEGSRPAGNVNAQRLFEGLAAGEYEVEVFLKVGELVTSVGGEVVTVDCAGLANNCADRSDPVVTVELPPKEGEPWNYMVYIYDAEEFDIGNFDYSDPDDPLEFLDDAEGESGTSVQLNPGSQGDFVVVLVRDNGNQVSYYEVNVSCPRKKPRSSTVTTPPLPSTGSDSSTSLLILAPAMIALGGGLVLARRRMVKA